MNKWPHVVKPTTTEEIRNAVKDAEWQRLRLSMKGMTTERKLVTLDAWRNRKVFMRDGVPCLFRHHEVCIDNYINALKRGGQLNDALEAVK